MVRPPPSSALFPYATLFLSAPTARVAVAVSTPPAAPSVIDNVAGLAASVKKSPVCTTREKVAVRVTAGLPPVALIVTVVVPGVAVEDAVNVTVAEHVGLQGLFVNTEAVTPVGRTEAILKVTGAVVAPAARVAGAVSTPPAPPAVRVNGAGNAANVKSKKPETTRVNVAVRVTTGVPQVACIVITVED